MIAGFADDDGRCWPSQAALAAIMQQCDRTVRRKMQKLEALGRIEVSERRKAHGERDSSLIVLKGFATGQQGVRLSAGHNRPSPPDNTVSGITTNQEEPRERARAKQDGRSREAPAGGKMPNFGNLSSADVRENPAESAGKSRTGSEAVTVGGKTAKIGGKSATGSAADDVRTKRAENAHNARTVTVHHWRPSSADKALAIDKGWCPDGEGEKFAAYHAETTATPARWSWLWRSWIGHCADFSGIKWVPSPPTITPDMTRDQIREAWRPYHEAEMRKYGVT